MSATLDDHHQPLPGIRAEGLCKVFGRRAGEAVRQLDAGADPEEVTRRLGVTSAVLDASFEVASGEIFVIMGLSGSGKSTLIRMLNGLLEPTAGQVYVNGQDLAGLSAAGLRRLRQQRMSMVFQHFALLPHRTVLDNAGYALRVRGVDRPSRSAKAREALSLVGLEGWEHRLPHELSGGMKQRVGLARALAAGTDIMLMDEAFSALDPLIRREMQDQLLKLQSSLHKTIVFVTHDLHEAMRLGDRIAMMRAGRIVQIGTSEEILQDPASDYVSQFVQDVDRTRVLTASSVMEPPRSAVMDTTGPRGALRVMRDEQTSAAFVVSRDGRLYGVITDDAAQAAVTARANRLPGPLDEPATVAPDTLLADVFAPSAESRLPVAVVDADHRLLGVIPRATLLGAMAGMTANHDGRYPRRAAEEATGSCGADFSTAPRRTPADPVEAVRRPPTVEPHRPEEAASRG